MTYRSRYNLKNHRTYWTAVTRNRFYERRSYNHGRKY